MVQRDDQARARMRVERGGQPARLLGRDQAERVGEREMRVGVRIEDRDAEPVLALGRQDEREGFVPQALQARRTAKPAAVGESRDSGRHAASASARSPAAGRRAQVSNPVALDGGDGRERPHAPQRLHRAERQVEAGGIGAVDDVDVMVARRDQRQRRELRKRREDVEELRPFGATSRRPSCRR